MNNHMLKAIEYFKEHDFVTEIDVSSVMNSIFRNKLKLHLSDQGILFNSEAIEIKGEWLYYLYNPDKFSDTRERRIFFNNYFTEKYRKV